MQHTGNVLIISDVQAPFHLPDTIPFLSALANEIQADHVVCVGDLLDLHCLARNYKPHPNAPSAGREFELSEEFLSELYIHFPTMYICEANHEGRLRKKAQDAGIPDQYLKDVDEAHARDGWHWDREWWLDTELGPVCVNHGDRKKGALNYAKTLGASVIQGHHHSDFGIQFQNSRHRILYGMDVGCLCDPEALALAYSRTSPLGQMQGTGVIVNGWPKLAPMGLDSDGRWDGVIRV